VTSDAQIIRSLMPVFVEEAQTIRSQLCRAMAGAHNRELEAIGHRLAGAAGTVQNEPLRLAAVELARGTTGAAPAAVLAGRVLAELDRALADAARVLSADGATGRVAGRGEHAVLLIDDDVVTVRLIERVLGSMPDVALTCVATGLEGLAAARTTAFRLALVDLRLPDIPGYDVVDALSRLDDPPDVVVLSAAVAPGLADERPIPGAKALLGKPFELDELRELVRLACAVGE
jgi:CheY-like chemotaxis protein/HPt (histidine-containing phosphotransfer) domain-containing protein